jgi:hypothetical protein
MTRPLTVLAQIVSADKKKTNYGYRCEKCTHIQNVKWLDKKNLSEQQAEYEDIIS